MQDRLGRGDGDDQVRLHQCRVDAQVDPARRPEVDEIVSLGVVDDHPPLEPSTKVRGHEETDLPRRRPARQASGNEDGDLFDAEARELVGDGRSCDVARPGSNRRNRQRRLFDHDRRRAAGPHQFRQRFAGQREGERVEDCAADILERLALPWRPQHEIVVVGVCDDEARVTQQRDPGHERRRAVAAVTPRAMKIPPETQRRSFAPVPLRRSLPASRSASSAYIASDENAITTNSAPRTATCADTEPRLEVDELWQKGEKEERRLRVEHVHDRSLHVELPVRCGRELNLGVLLAAEDAADADDDQIDGSDKLDRGERGRGRGDQRGEPDRRGRDVDEPAARDTECRHEARAPSLVDALRDDVGDRRPGHDGQQERRETEDRERRPGRHYVTARRRSESG